MFYDDGYIFYDATDMDDMPFFSESKRFASLENYEKMLLRDYIRSCIREHWEYSGSFPKENELIEIRKRTLSVLEEDWHIVLKNDKQWRQFFQDNVKALRRFPVPAISVAASAPMPGRSVFAPIRRRQSASRRL